MKAISLHQPWASWIADGLKTIETRTWRTNHRGDLLVVSSKRPELAGLPTGQALAIVTLADCRLMTKADEPAARCELYSGAWAWMLTNIRKIKPFAVKGSLGFYDVDVQTTAEIIETTRACRVCGCTDRHACPGGCSWAREDICSRCI